MRVTADTNTVISGLFWKGSPRRVLDTARDGIIDLYTTNSLLTELEDVLRRVRFARHLDAAKTTAQKLVDGYSALATVVEPAKIDTVIVRDPDDDMVLACAISSGSDAIVSGDNDLLSLREYQNISILTAADLLKTLNL